MNRRTLLRGAAGAGSLLLAGCLAGGGPAAGPGDGNETTTDDGTTDDGSTPTDDGSTPTDDGSTPTDDGGSDDGPSPSGTEFEIVSAGCGTETNEATVSRDEAAGSVVVEGTITAPSACYTASLAAADYGSETDSLWVDVVTEERADAGACAQCLTEIEYRVTATFEGGLPARVGVTHDDEVVCEPAENSTTESA